MYTWVSQEFFATSALNVYKALPRPPFIISRSNRSHIVPRMKDQDACVKVYSTRSSADLFSRVLVRCRRCAFFVLSLLRSSPHGARLATITANTTFFYLVYIFAFIIQSIRIESGIRVHSTRSNVNSVVSVSHSFEDDLGTGFQHVRIMLWLGATATTIKQEYQVHRPLARNPSDEEHPANCIWELQQYFRTLAARCLGTSPAWTRTSTTGLQPETTIGSTLRMTQQMTGGSNYLQPWK